MRNALEWKHSPRNTKKVEAFTHSRNQTRKSEGRSGDDDETISSDDERFGRKVEGFRVMMKLFCREEERKMIGYLEREVRRFWIVKIKMKLEGQKSESSDFEWGKHRSFRFWVRDGRRQRWWSETVAATMESVMVGDGDCGRGLRMRIRVCVF